MKIFCDLSADAETLSLLTRGVAPHELVWPAKPAPSVLSKSNQDPALAEADIAFGQPDAAGVLRAGPLRWVHISSAGYTRYDTAEFRQAAAERKLLVTNSSTVYAEPCAEHVLAFMLAQARKLPEGLRAGAAGDSSSWAQLREDSILLQGQTVLLLGFGSIARCLVELLGPFRMRIAALRRKPPGEDGVQLVGTDNLAQALAEADHVVNVLPANSSSTHFMSAPQFAAMKKGAVFYNVGRGATVDQDALGDALRSGHLAAAWLDVTEPEPLPANHPLLRSPNCYITPHTAGGHRREAAALVRHFLGNFQRFLHGTPLNDRIL
jgi:phosphoglycerate dehydrogenase-like enzyme